MTKRIELKSAFKQIPFDNNSVLVLLDRLGQESIYGKSECARNIYLLDSLGIVIWQISSNFDSSGDPFTNFVVDNGNINAYRWDGGVYQVDFKTGLAIPKTLFK